MRIVSKPSKQGDWTKFGGQETWVRFHRETGAIEISEDGKLQQSYNLRDLEALSYTIDHSVENWHDSVRDRDCEIDNYTYTAKIKLKNFEITLFSEASRYDQGLKHRLFSLPFLEELAEQRDIEIHLSGLEHAPNFSREPEFRDDDWQPPQGFLDRLFRFLTGS